MVVSMQLMTSAYFAGAVSYASKMIVKLATGQDEDGKVGGGLSGSKATSKLHLGKQR